MYQSYPAPVSNLRKGSLTSQIVAVARRCPVRGVTSEELFDKLSNQGVFVTSFQTLTGRFSELKNKGILVPTGTTRTLASTGKPGQVLVINPQSL